MNRAHQITYRAAVVVILGYSVAAATLAVCELVRMHRGSRG